MTMSIMKGISFISLFLLAFLAAPWVQAAGAYERALKKAGRKPVVLFCYGANYDKVSEATYQEFIKKRKIMPAVRGTIFLEVPIYQLPNDKEKKQWERVMGERSLPGGIWSYPCLALVDSYGGLRGVVQSAEDMKDAESAGKALAELLALYKEQEDLLYKADKASPARRASLLAQAADINLRLPANLHSARRGGGKDEIKDEIGLRARLNFTPEEEVVQALQPMDLERANTYIRALMANGCFSPRQRQEIMAAYAGHLRRNNASKERLRAAYTEMRNIDPKSMYGAYAEGALELWVDPPQEENPAEGSDSGGRSAMGDTKTPS